MDELEYKQACTEAFEIVRNSITPKRTGNMAFSSLHYVWEGEDGLTFRMWVDEKIAPYVVYTNEVWISPKWKGKTNPNEGWWNDACEFVINWVAYKLEGNIQND